jgi:hypothetical protein
VTRSRPAIRRNRVKLWTIPRNRATLRKIGDGAKQMEQLAKDDPSYIARRLFNALCERFPDRYIALIEQPPLQPALATADSPSRYSREIIASETP